MSGFWETLLVGGLRSKEHEDRCVHFIDKKHNVIESFVWMGICGIMVLSFSLPQHLKHSLWLSRRLSLQAHQQEAKTKSSSSSSRRAASAVAVLCLGAMLSMVAAEWQRQSLAMLLQFPFCVLLSLLVVSAGHAWMPSLRHVSIVVNVLLLPSVPNALLSLALEPTPFVLFPSSSSPPSPHSSTVAAKAAVALLLLLAPIHLLSACNNAALHVALRVPYACPLLGAWYAVQVRWTVCLGVAVFTHANLELLLCPPHRSPLQRSGAGGSGSGLLPAWLVGLAESDFSWPLYRSALTLLLAGAGAVYAWAALRVARARAQAGLAGAGAGARAGVRAGPRAGSAGAGPRAAASAEDEEEALDPSKVK